MSERTIGKAPPPLPAVGHAQVLAIALPITLSNATVPLIGLVDTILIGQYGAPHMMGAVAVTAIIFNMIYWAFGFLRMGTTGLTAQALGADDRREIAGHLVRALLVSAIGAALLLVFQNPLRSLMFWTTGGSPAVVAAGHTYFDIRIWAAPAGLINFALLGWFIGLGLAKIAFVLQLLLNLTNILLAVAFTIGLNAEIEGVAYAAVIAEYSAAVAGLLWAHRSARQLKASAPLTDAIDGPKLRRSLAINLDITIRSLVAFSALIAFTAYGASTGDVTLAANSLLLNIQSVTIYLLDGCAFAAEALVGRAVGAGDKAFFWRSIKLSTIWALVFALICSAILWMTGDAILALSTKNTDVQAIARQYLPWVIMAPIVGVWCFQLDGIFIGATRTREMRNMMIASAAVFGLAYALLPAYFGNHGLWAAMMVLFIARAITLLTRMPTLVQHCFPRNPSPH